MLLEKVNDFPVIHYDGRANKIVAWQGRCDCKRKKSMEMYQRRNLFLLILQRKDWCFFTKGSPTNYAFVIRRKSFLKRIFCEEGLAKTEVAVQRCSIKKVFLEILQNSQENTCAIVSFLIKLPIKKETLAQLFFCEFCEISRNTLFHRTPLWWLLLSEGSPNYFFNIRYANYRKGNSFFMFDEIIRKGFPYS